MCRHKRRVNGDPRLHTAISDLEVEQRETRGHLWYFKYPLEGEDGKFITVATTRPETMLGDSAVAVHPEDGRYKHLVGRRCILPIVGRPLPSAEVVGHIEEVNAKSIRAATEKLFAGPPTLAALGPIGSVESLEEIKTRLN